MMITLFSFIHASDFLMPDEAFKPSAKVQNDKILLSIKLGPDIHLYKNKLQAKLHSDTLFAKEIQYPPALPSKDGEIYNKDVTLVILLGKKGDAKATEKVDVTLNFQGCSDKGLCYEPQTKNYTLDVNTQTIAALQEKPKSSSTKTDTDSIADSFKNESMFVVLLTFFGFGLLLSMTPCIFPMIPILSSIIVSQGEGMSAKKGFFLSLIYVLAMAFAYTLAGVLAGLFGSNLQAAMQNPYVVISFALVFVALAFSMFGFYEIGLPASIQSKLSRVSDNASNKGGLIGIAIMGFLSALIVGPCVAPPLAGTLVYIGQTGDALFGGLALFVMSLGMGMPLLLIGAGAGKFMPKPGGWMSNVSKVFGVIMLAIAIWMLEKIASATVIMALWATLFITSSVYLGALEPLEKHRGWNALIKAIGVILLLLGSSLFLGLLSGATNYLKPFEKFTQSPALALQGRATQELDFQIVRSLDELNTLLAQNKGKKIMLDFAAKWCTSCKELDEITFQDAKVKEALSSYVLIRADVTENSQEQKELAKAYGVFGPPAIIFFDTDTKVVKNKTIVGYKPPQEFVALIP